jgi:hypothetical protein
MAKAFHEGDLLTAMLHRTVEKSGGFLKGERLGQGRENAKQLLKDNPDMLRRSRRK